MNVILVYPAIAGAGFGCLGRRPWSPETHLIHHGLASLGACLAAAGHAVDLIDLRALRGWGGFCRAVRSRDSALWGISVTSPERDIALRCAHIIRQEHLGARVVVGGAHPSVCPSDFTADPAIDHVIQGEGELALVVLVDALLRGESPPQVWRGAAPDLDALPFVARELFDVGAELRGGFYPTRLGLPTPMVTLIAGRGCRYNCAFCQPAERAVFGPRVRRRSIDHVLAELRVLRERYAFRSLMIHDDCLLEDRAWALRFAEAYASEFGQPWFCQARADIVAGDEDLIRALREAGLAALSIGFESGSDRVLRLLHKGTTVAQNRWAAEVCRRLGVRVFGNYMLGLPSETPAEMMATAQLVRDMEGAVALRSVSVYAPSPGSALYEQCRRDGLLLQDGPAGYRRDRLGGKVAGVDYIAVDRAMACALGLSPARAALRRWTAHPAVRCVVEPLRALGSVQAGLDTVRRVVYRL
ncbi:MAG: B12-binding domain-containing radical SAM protein [Chloroflexi bacterium]|nr:B12-binding domain-containing radical SAM protein [Chloroflexota bacterium]MBU1747041.1 B12-binding domain-containing radical SAM protein [Chloroflexota bacterium]